MIKLKKKNVENSNKVNPKEIMREVCEYNELKVKEKIIAERKKELGEKIKSYSDNYGVKDDKGSIYVKQDGFIFGKVAKKSININMEKAKKFLITKGLWAKVVTMVEQVDEDKLEKLIASGKLKESDLEKICDVKVSYSLYLAEDTGEQEEEMPVVQTGKLRK